MTKTLIPKLISTFLHLPFIPPLFTFPLILTLVVVVVVVMVSATVLASDLPMGTT